MKTKLYEIHQPTEADWGDMRRGDTNDRLSKHCIKTDIVR